MPSRAQVLWAGPEGPCLTAAANQLGQSGIRHVPSFPDAVASLREGGFDAVVIDASASGCDPAALLEHVQRADDLVPAVICAPGMSTCDVVRLVKLGAYHCFTDARADGELARTLGAAIEDGRSRQLLRLAQSVGDERWRKFMIGDSPAMRNVERIIQLAAPRRCTVLINGETGTGKEMTARALHAASPRADLPMVAVNCSAIPENLLETELFGHTKGAFTGAVAARVGRFEQANGSTLFLDEIGDMPLEIQAKLLRVLQEREVQRVGSSETIRVDVRVIAASNQNLVARAREGKFREDLYYRLNVVPISMPPLRDRRGDIPMLAHHFAEKICRGEGLPVKRISREAVDRLLEHSWPGNVRELENTLSMAVVMSGDRNTIYPSDFELPNQPVLSASRRDAPAAPDAVLPDDGIDFERTVAQFERSIVRQALEKAGGNKTLAADMLRIPRTTLISKIRALDTAAGN